jgi:hypothetical protein
MSSFEERRAHWRSVLDDHRDSGLTIAAFCAARGISTHTFSYWRTRQIAPPASEVEWLSQPEPVVPCLPSLTLRIGGAAIDVAPGFDPSLLRDIVTALSSPC